jgi:hypothetical protein
MTRRRSPPNRPSRPAVGSREAVKALLVANDFLERQLDELR